MATLTIADLDNGKRDLETVDAVANNQADTTTTRYGDSVLTLVGALRRLGYQAPAPYAPGVAVTSGLTTVERDGVIYAPRVELLPFTTGAWAAGQWRVVQNTHDTNQVYRFHTLAEAQSAAATLPEGASVIVEGDSQGHVNAGQYVEDTGLPAHTLQSYAALLAYSGKQSVIRLTSKNIAGIFTYDVALPNTSDGGTRFAHASGVGAWQREVGASVLAEWFGMLPTDQGGGDISPMIDKALEVHRSLGKPLQFQGGWFVHSLPLVFKSSDWVIGAGADKTAFQKTTNTPASGLPIYQSPGAPGATGGTDNYNVDACVILLPPAPESYVRDVRLSGMYFESRQNSRSQYGLYAPRLCLSHFQDLSFSSQIAIYSRDSWMVQWDRVKGGRCTAGWWIDGTGTSNVFNSCWAHDFLEVGWFIDGMGYSVMNGVGADSGATGSNYPAYAFRFKNAQITMNGAGAEGITGGLMMLEGNSRITTNSLFCGYMNERTAEVNAIVGVFNVISVGEGSTLVLDNAALNFTGVNGKARPYLAFGADSTIEVRGSTQMPTGVMIDGGGNQWGGGIIKTRQGFDVAAFAAFSGTSGEVVIQRKSANVTVTRQGVGDYSIAVAGGGTLVGQVSSDLRAEVIAVSAGVARYQFKTPAGAKADPGVVHWLAV